MINGTNGYLATPAVPGSTLKTIKITTSNGISASAKVTIKDTSNKNTQLVKVELSYE